MARPFFEHAAFIAAARDLVAQAGPNAVTVSSLTERLGAPTGSFYYRFASRDVLLAELWLATALAFQEGFVAAIKAGDGLTAALHTPIWVRAQLIGSIRRECLDHVIIGGEAHLRRVLETYARYYNEVRTHRSLGKDAPLTRPVQHLGRVNSCPVLGGLHHHYVRI